MANIFVVTALTAKEKANKNADIDKVVFIDVDNNRVVHGRIEQAKIPTFNTKTRRYINDEVNIEESVGTLLFVNNEHNFYGVLRLLGTKLTLEWITKQNLLEDKNYNKIANIHNLPIDITSQGLRVFNKNWLPFAKQIFVSEINYKMTTKEKFMQDITGVVESVEKDIKNEEPTLYETKEDTQINRENNKDTENTNENINIDLVKRLVELEKREEAVREKEKDLTEKSNRLSRLLAKLETVDIDKAVGAMVDVDDISTFDKREDSSISKADLATEFSLKIASSGDIVTISKDYYSKVFWLTRKTLEQNVAYTMYKLMVSLKFERESEYSIFGIIDYNEDLDVVKFKVLKSYSKSGITEHEISDFHLEYLKDRKVQSMR